MKRLVSLVASLVLANTASVAACDLIESYTARLGIADHFNSRGERLASAAAIIRQDRANFFVFGKRDPEDEADSFFASKENREILERMLEKGDSSPEALNEIINRTPLIMVSVCRSNRGDYVSVIVK
jgi:hypothetical protein